MGRLVRLCASLLVPLAVCACAGSREAAIEDAWLEQVYDNGGGKLDTEAVALPAAQGRAVRKGDDLIFALAGGKTKTLHNDIAGCAHGDAHCDGYRLVADLPARHFYLVNEYFHEGGDYWLIDDRSGRFIRIDNVPQFSPNGRRFLVEDDDVAGYHQNDLEIWRREGDGAVLEWGAALTEADTGVSHQFGPPHSMLLSWQGDRITLHFITMLNGGPDPNRIVVMQWNGTLTRGADGWHLSVRAPGS
jgi:hypothetical protein